jgi:hypothetical protein
MLQPISFLLPLIFFNDFYCHIGCSHAQPAVRTLCLRPFNLTHKKKKATAGFEIRIEDSTLEPLTTAPLS